MSEYKNYLLRQLGIKESSIKTAGIQPSNVDPDELEMGEKDETEHTTDPKISKTIALQHLKKHPDYYDRLQKAGLDEDEFPIQQMLSPTAMTPVIAVAVRGSKTGGLPSGADDSISSMQSPPTLDGVDVSRMTKGQLGGYEPISVERDNSKIINKTPVNPSINSNDIISNGSQTILNPHPHQVQLDKGEPPQAVTGASTDSDPSLKAKVDDEDDQENGQEEINVDVNETFKRHLGLMKECIETRNLDECDGDPNCKCGCDDKEEENKEPKKVEEKYSAPFSKMRGLANLGERRLGKDGIWENHVGADDPFVTHWKMDKEKAGMVKVDESKLNSMMERLSKKEQLSEKEEKLKTLVDKRKQK